MDCLDFIKVELLLGLKYFCFEETILGLMKFCALKSLFLHSFGLMPNRIEQSLIFQQVCIIPSCKLQEQVKNCKHYKLSLSLK